MIFTFWRSFYILSSKTYKNMNQVHASMMVGCRLILSIWYLGFHGFGVNCCNIFNIIVLPSFLCMCSWSMNGILTCCHFGCLDHRRITWAWLSSSICHYCLLSTWSSSISCSGFTWICIFRSL